MWALVVLMPGLTHYDYHNNLCPRMLALLNSPLVFGPAFQRDMDYGWGQIQASTPTR